MSQAVQPTFQRANEIHDTGRARIHLLVYYRSVNDCWVARRFDEVGNAWEATFDDDYAANKRVRALFWAENPGHECSDRCVRLLPMYPDVQGGTQPVPLKDALLDTPPSTPAHPQISVIARLTGWWTRVRR